MIMAMNILSVIGLALALGVSLHLLRIRRDFLLALASFWIVLLIQGFVVIGNILEHGSMIVSLDRVEEYVEMQLPLFYLLFVISMVLRDSMRTISDQRMKLSRWNLELSEEIQKKGQALDKTYQELITTRTQLMQKNRNIAFGRMIRRVSHLINTPLGNCVTAASLVELPGDEKNDAALTILRRGLRQISDILREVRDLVEVNPRGSISEFRLDDLVREIAESVTEGLERHPKLQIAASGDMVVSSYQDDLRRIFQELTVNAVQHNTDLPDLRIRYDLEYTDEEYRICVSDNGRGISVEDPESAFDPLSTSRFTDRSLGMGLFMVRNILQTLFEGDISLDTGNDATTNFIIRIPARSLRMTEAV